MTLEKEDITMIVEAVMAELDRRKQIEQLADAIVRKQAELNRQLKEAPQAYQRRPMPQTATNATSPAGDGQQQH